MQACLVRPVMTGLLAIIIAGLWQGPVSNRAGSPLLYQSSCHQAGSGSLQPTLIGAMIRRGAHC